MIAYKLVRRLKRDKSLAPLFINKRLRYKVGETYEAESHPTKGFALRPGFHCTLSPNAPHLSRSKDDRVWLKVYIYDYEFFNRPESQGGQWALAQRMKVLKEL